MEFKKLSAVEAVEVVSDTASVLIEENGVVKRAPKSEVGGGGGGEKPDMVITVNAYSMESLTNGNCSITEGSVDSVFAAFHEGRYPIIKVRFKLNENNAYTAIREEYDAKVCTYGESLWISFLSLYPYGSNLYMHKIHMNGDGTISRSDAVPVALNWD